MKAIVKTDEGKTYEIDCVIDVTFVGGMLCLIALDERCVAHSYTYSADSLNRGNIKLIW